MSDDTVWISFIQMSDLFQPDKPTISHRICDNSPVFILTKIQQSKDTVAVKQDFL